MADAKSSNDERVFIRLYGATYEGQKSFKISPQVPFKQLKRNLAGDCSLRYGGVLIDPESTPQDLGLKTGVVNAVRIEVVHEASAAEPVETSASPPAPPKPAPKWAAAPSTAGSEQERAQPRSGTPEVRSDTPQERNEVPVFRLSTPPIVATPPADRAATITESSNKQSAPAWNDPGMPNLSSHHSAPAVDNVSWKPSSSARNHRAAPVDTSSAAATSTVLPSSSLGGPGRLATGQRLPKPHHELQAELFPGVPSRALDRHTPHESPPRPLGAAMTRNRRQNDTFNHTLNHGGPRPVDSSEYGRAIPVQSDVPWSQFYTLRPQREAPKAPGADWRNDSLRGGRAPGPVMDDSPIDRVNPTSTPAVAISSPSHPSSHLLSAEVTMLRYEIDRLKGALETLQETVDEERARRELVEVQLKQLAGIVLNQMEQLQTAAADDYAVTEHRRLMQSLKEQRRQSSQPRAAANDSA